MKQVEGANRVSSTHMQYIMNVNASGFVIFSFPINESNCYFTMNCN